MAISYYKGHDSYVIYGEETSFGAGATPSGSNFVGLIQNFSMNAANNSIRTQGLGEGRNATNIVLGGFDVNGSIDFQVNDFTFMQYAIGTRAGAGSAADPYELQELENVGYSGATEIPTLEFQIGSEGGSNDYTRTVTGVVINTLTLNANQGEVLNATCDWIGKTLSVGTSLTTYTPGSEKPFVFQEGSVTVNGDTVFACTAFSVTLNNNMQTFRALGDRDLQQPTTGLRTYDFNLTIRMNYNDAGSTISGIEAFEIFMGALGNSSPNTGGTATKYPVSLDITEGASTGDRVVNIDLEECVFDTAAEAIALDGGVIELTISGMAQAGLTDSTAKVPIRYYTIA